MASLAKTLCWVQELEISFSSKWDSRDSIQGVGNLKFRMSLFLITGRGVSEFQQQKITCIEIGGLLWALEYWALLCNLEFSLKVEAFCSSEFKTRGEKR